MSGDPNQEINVNNANLLLPTTTNVIDSKKKFPFIDSNDLDRLNTIKVSVKCYDNSNSTYLNQVGTAFSFRPIQVKQRIQILDFVIQQKFLKILRNTIYYALKQMLK